MKGANIVAIGLGALVVLLTVSFALRSVSAGDALVLATDSSVRVLLLFLLASLSMGCLRAIRLRVLLPDAPSTTSFPNFLSVIFVRNTCADLLPAKIGSAVVIPLAATRLGVTAAQASAAWGIEYLLDLIALIPLVALLTFPVAELVGVPWWGPLVGAGIGGTIAFAALAILHRLSPRLSEKLYRRSTFFADAFVTMRALSSGPVLLTALILSVAIRALKYLALYLLAVAMLTPLGFGFDSLPIGVVTLATFSSEVAGTLPGLSIAGFGAPQGVWGAIISQLGAPLSLAVVVGLAAHLLSQAYALVVGAFGFLYLYVVQGRWSVRARGPTAAVVTTIALLLALVSVGRVNGGEPRVLSPQSETGTIEHAGAAASPIVIPPVIADARIGDSFGIVKVPSTGPSEIVIDTEWHESEPAVAPDGSFLVFTRSRSLHRMAPREIWLLDRRTGSTRLLAKDARYPHISAEGGRVLFERGRTALWEISLTDGREREIFRPTGKLAGHAVVTPRLSPDGARVAFVTDSPERWWVHIADLRSGEVTRVAHGCQPQWRDASTVLFIKNRGSRGGSGIAEYSIREGRERFVLDTERREYFVSGISNDGGLLFADAPAADSDHEHGTFTARYLTPSGAVKTLENLPYSSVRWPQWDGAS